MAGALVAAKLREHRVDVANEVDVWPAADANHADRQGDRDRGGAVAVDDAERALAVGERPEKAARAGRDEWHGGRRRSLEPHAAGEIDRAAVDEFACNHQLGRGKRPCQRDRRGFDRE